MRVLTSGWAIIQGPPTLRDLQFRCLAFSAIVSRVLPCIWAALPSTRYPPGTSKQTSADLLLQLPSLQGSDLQILAASAAPDSDFSLL